MINNNKICNILSIENSTNAFSFCYFSENIFIYKEKFTNKNNSTFILDIINSILYKNKIKIKNINAIAYGNGPGSYTGLRLSHSITQVLSLCWKIPILEIPSTFSLALEYFHKFNVNNVLICIEIKMDCIYCEIYEKKNNKIYILFKKIVNNVNELRIENGDFIGIGIGSGCIKYKNTLLKNNMNLRINENIIYPKAIYTNIAAQISIKKNRIKYPGNLFVSYI